MTDRSSATATEATVTAAAATSSSTPVLSVGSGCDHRRDYETSRRDTKADCEHGNLSTRVPGRLLQRADAFLVRPQAFSLQ